MRKTSMMRELLAGDQIVVSPGVYDGYSLRLVQQLGYKTASTTGAGLANSRLVVPDTGTMSLLENVAACRHLARSVSIPLMADADTGYGNAVSVYSTVQYFEEAGVAGINIEDQSLPKRCGHMRGKELVSREEMAKKIEAAVAARVDSDFVINARTDSLVIEGIDGALQRIRAYADAGADMIFPDAVGSEADIERLVNAVDIPISINVGFGIRSRATTPLIPIKRLQELGVRRVTVPRMLTAAAIHGMRTALTIFAQTNEEGVTTDRPDLLASLEDITGLMDYERLAELEQRFLLDEQLAGKYGAGASEGHWLRSS